MSSSPIKRCSQTGAGTNGATGCDSQDPGANRMVLRNGCGPKTEWPGENMC